MENGSTFPCWFLNVNTEAVVQEAMTAGRRFTPSKPVGWVLWQIREPNSKPER